MNLNSFLNEGKPKSNFKVIVALGNTKLTRFISAYSDEDAKSILLSEMKKDYPGFSYKIKEVKNLKP